jgi:hypothetical protein
MTLSNIGTMSDVVPLRRLYRRKRRLRMVRMAQADDEWEHGDARRHNAPTEKEKLSR